MGIGAAPTAALGSVGSATPQDDNTALGATDDARDPDGLSAFSFAQAQEKARTFFTRKAREVAGDTAPSDGPYRVADALDDYFKSYAKRGKAFRPRGLPQTFTLCQPLERSQSRR